MASLRGIHLTRTDENAEEIEALANQSGGRVGLEGVLSHLDRQARRAWLPRLLGRAVHRAWTWDAHDGRDPVWWPQGISTSADSADASSPDGRVLGRRLVVVSWYSTDKRGSRVTFLDLDTLRYRHVVLVVPSLDQHGLPTMQPLNVHAGGIVWNGPYLHIAATAQGFFTAHVDDIMRGSTSQGGDFVLPVRFAYRAHADEAHRRLRYSFLSLDRSGAEPAMLAGEYGRRGDTTRFARYPLDLETGLPRADTDGISRPAALEQGMVQMQGAVVARGRFHVTVSHGSWAPGSVYAGRPGAFAQHRLAVPMGPEDVAYWPQEDLLWSVSEHPRRRWVFCMRRAWFD